MKYYSAYKQWLSYLIFSYRRSNDYCIIIFTSKTIHQLANHTTAIYQAGSWYCNLLHFSQFKFSFNMPIRLLHIFSINFYIFQMFLQVLCETVCTFSTFALTGSFLKIKVDTKREPTKYQPSGARGTHSPPATPHHLAARGPRNGWQGLESCLHLGFLELLSTFVK